MTLDKIVEDLYEGTLDPVPWDRALLSIADMVRASGAMLYAFNPSDGTVLRDENHRVDPQVVFDYARVWTFEDLRRTYFLRMPVGSPATEVSLNIEDLKQSRIFNDFLVPVDMPHFLPVWLHKSRHKAVALSLQAGQKRGPFERNDVKLLRQIAPHLARTLEIRDRLEAAQVRASNLANVLNNTTFGVIVLDARRKILEVNAAAAALFSDGQGLQRGKNGTLKISAPKDVLAKWMHGADLPNCMADSLLHLPRASRLPLSLLIVPIPRANTLWMSGNPAWVVLAFDVEKRLLVNQQTISRDLGLSEREAQVCALLAAGLNIPRIARRMHVTTFTIRTQLHSAFEKTGCHSQAELVRRLLLGPGVIPPV